MKTIMSARVGIGAVMATAGVGCLLASRIGDGRGAEVWLAIIGCVLLGFAGAMSLAAIKRRLLGQRGGSDGE